MLLVQTLVGLVRARFASRWKNVDGLIAEAQRAMHRAKPEERFAALARVIVDVRYQERREPRRPRVLRAALLI